MEEKKKGWRRARWRGYMKKKVWRRKRDGRAKGEGMEEEEKEEVMGRKKKS